MKRTKKGNKVFELPEVVLESVEKLEDKISPKATPSIPTTGYTC